MLKIALLLFAAACTTGRLLYQFRSVKAARKV